MKILKQNIKFSDLPMAEKKSEIEWDAIHWKEIFKNEETWKDCTHNDYRKQAKMVLIADEDIDYKKYSLIELKDGRRKWVRNDDIESEAENERLGIY
jgi:hypothetical protein